MVGAAACCRPRWVRHRERAYSSCGPIGPTTTRLPAAGATGEGRGHEMYEIPVRTRRVRARGTRRGTVSVTPTLESALSGLPAKPRVHELSKRLGITNKELLSALAERGLTISSASSSVPLAVAQEVIQTLLGGADTAAPADT